jgi:hypothetical protein
MAAGIEMEDVCAGSHILWRLRFSAPSADGPYVEGRGRVCAGVFWSRLRALGGRLLHRSLGPDRLGIRSHSAAHDYPQAKNSWRGEAQFTLADIADPPAILGPRDGKATIYLDRDVVSESPSPFVIEGVVDAEAVVQLIQAVRANRKPTQTLA